LELVKWHHSVPAIVAERVKTRAIGNVRYAVCLGDEYMRESWLVRVGLVPFEVAQGRVGTVIALAGDDLGEASGPQYEVESLPVVEEPVSPAVEGTVQAKTVANCFLAVAPGCWMVLRRPNPIEVGSREPNDAASGKSRATEGEESTGIVQGQMFDEMLGEDVGAV
jgi:hypothetical protein